MGVEPIYSVEVVCVERWPMSCCPDHCEVSSATRGRHRQSS
uniref:Uncharacterized protein n=1 Tax=Anguilla anguilla TaxID=7936 RepID=A0A0E9QAG7_ANGAN